LQTHPELQRCVASCIHCGIRFLTHPRNAGRRNLRCPFGCRLHHQRQRSRQRSAAYYQTAEGKRKKKRLNGRRSRSPRCRDGQQEDLGRQVPPAARPQAFPANEPRTDESPLTVELRLEGVVLDGASVARSPMLPHVRMLIGLIEGLQLSRAEVVRLLRQAMRQHRIGARRRIDYVLGFLHQHPP